jgi:hypothetical protein
VTVRRRQGAAEPSRLPATGMSLRTDFHAVTEDLRGGLLISRRTPGSRVHNLDQVNPLNHPQELGTAIKVRPGTLADASVSDAHKGK